MQKIEGRITAIDGIPIYMWLEDNQIEDGAWEQARNLAKLPFAFHHIALMPDCHQGYGMPIGGVLATTDVVIPNAVGVDIGCGMLATKTSLMEMDVHLLKSIMGTIRETVPVGFAHHKESQGTWFMKPDGMDSFVKYDVVCREYDSAQYQIGTLGGGNHFIEIQKGSDGYIWFMIHSGSRNLGKQVADHYNKIAKEKNKTYFSKVPESYDLAFLSTYSPVGQQYLAEMNYCVDFALLNRKLMAQRICEAFEKFTAADFEEPINIAHNYARMEHHYGRNVMIHRKGATSAKNGEIGIIPGSQGTKSYIVKGKGNRDSFESCSHGAGRKMGRKEAQRSLDLATEIKKLDDLGIVHAIRNKEDLDEASGAYKDIDVVMENQKDLVDILIELTPLGVIKG